MSASILLLDDDPAVTYALKGVLRSEGYTAYTANDAEQAKVIITEHSISLVIMDFIFPGQDGAQIVKELEKIDETLKIIILTGYCDILRIVEGLRLDVYKVLLKPVDPEVLISTLKNMCLEEMDPHQLVDTYQKMYERHFIRPPRIEDL